MMSTAVLRGHAVHFIVFGVPIAALVGTIGWQELRGRMRERHGTAAPGRRAAMSDAPTNALWIAAAGLVSAAGMHAAVVPEHFREYVPYGIFFAALSVGQCWLAVVVTRRGERRTVLYVALASVWVVALWLVSRTTGLPIGPEPWQAEEFGRLDIASSCAEILTAAGCFAHLWLVRDHERSPVPRVPELTR
jgi:hypothetical protein